MGICCSPTRIIMDEGAFCSPLYTLHILILQSFSLAAIDFSPPYVLSGSSDKHMKLMDLSTGVGWCTSPEPDPDGNTDPAPVLNRQPCEACGGIPPLPKPPARQPTHSDLVRSVALNDSFVVSGSYDHTVKVISFSFRPEYICSHIVLAPDLGA